MPRPRTPLGRLRESYRTRVDNIRTQLAALGPQSPFENRTEAARRQLLAELDTYYVGAAPLRSIDPDVRRLRKAERRARAQQEAAP